MRTVRSVEGQRHRLAAHLPDAAEILRGALVERFTRCGKAACRCQSDPSARHGPYRYLVTTVGRGRTRSILVQPEQLAWVRAAVRRYRRLEELVEQLSELNAELLQARQSEARRARLR